MKDVPRLTRSLDTRSRSSDSRNSAAANGSTVPGRRAMWLGHNDVVGCSRACRRFSSMARQ